jgi:transposase InsO family protein
LNEFLRQAKAEPNFVYYICGRTGAGKTILRQSMSRKANCWDNAPQESFFGHMKEDVNFEGKTHEDITLIVNDWMDYYNNDRFQWGLANFK